MSRAKRKKRERERERERERAKIGQGEEKSFGWRIAGPSWQSVANSLVVSTLYDLLVVSVASDFAAKTTNNMYDVRCTLYVALFSCYVDRHALATIQLSVRRTLYDVRGDEGIVGAVGSRPGRRIDRGGKMIPPLPMSRTSEPANQTMHTHFSVTVQLQ